MTASRGLHPSPSTDNKTVSFLYDKRGRRTKRINPNGTYAEYNYSGSRLAGITHKKSSGTVFLSYSYAYDNAGNIIKITGADETKNYSYDQTYRLIRADYVSASGTTNLIEEFSYDPAGNMIEYKKNGVVTVMQYDADDKLVSDTEFNYAYDLAGKLRQKIRKSDNTVSEAHDYGWDNRTAKISAENKVFEYQYDVLGRRISKTENNIATSILFDGDNAYQEYNASGEKTAEYMFSERIDEPLLMTKGGQEYTYHQNHLGTVMGISGADESLVNEYEYTAYGMDRGSAEIVDQPYQYTAREKIGDTGLHYYRSRVMRSGNGGFTREDDAMDGVNWRGYGFNNPISFFDPYGFEPISEGTLRGWVQNYRNTWTDDPNRPNDNINPLSDNQTLALIFVESSGEPIHPENPGFKGLMQVGQDALNVVKSWYTPSLTYTHDSLATIPERGVEVGIMYLKIMWGNPLSFLGGNQTIDNLLETYNGEAGDAKIRYRQKVLAFAQALDAGYSFYNNYNEIFAPIVQRINNGESGWPPPGTVQPDPEPYPEPDPEPDPEPCNNSCDCANSLFEGETCVNECGNICHGSLIELPEEPTLCTVNCEWGITAFKDCVIQNQDGECIETHYQEFSCTASWTGPCGQEPSCGQLLSNCMADQSNAYNNWNPCGNNDNGGMNSSDPTYIFEIKSLY